jgi:hypothetical protein
LWAGDRRHLTPRLIVHPWKRPAGRWLVRLAMATAPRPAWPPHRDPSLIRVRAPSQRPGRNNWIFSSFFVLRLVLADTIDNAGEHGIAVTFANSLVQIKHAFDRTSRGGRTPPRSALPPVASNPPKNAGTKSAASTATDRCAARQKTKAKPAWRNGRPPFRDLIRRHAAIGALSWPALANSGPPTSIRMADFSCGHALSAVGGSRDSIHHHPRHDTDQAQEPHHRQG